MRKLILLIVIIGVIAAGWFLYFNDGPTATEVSVCEAELTDLENTLEFSGEVVSQNMYSVMSVQGGQVELVYVSEGSHVKAGQTLLRLDKTELETQLEEAKLNAQMITDTATQTVMAQTDQDAAQAMMDEKAKIALALSQTTGYDYDSFNDALSADLSEDAAEMAAALEDVSLSETYYADITSSDTADTEIALANLAVQQLEDALEDMTLTSLIDGTVISVNINRGEVLLPGAVGMVIADTDNTCVTGYVYEKDVADLEEGMEVKIYTEKGYYIGVIDRIGDAATDVGDSTTFEKMAKIEIVPEKSLGKMLGAVVDIEIMLSSKKDVLALPIDCLTDDDAVYVVGTDGILEKRTVTTGFEDMFNVEIVSGVIAGETVVISPEDLEEGQQVVYDRD